MKRRVLKLLLLMLLAGAVFMGINVYKELRPQLMAEKAYEAMRAEAFGERQEGRGAERPRPDFDRLREGYPELAAWIYSPGTVIDYPVVKGTDNLYYLEHLADGTPNRNGAVFMDYRNQEDFSDRLTVLYGHHIRGGRMFSSLTEYKSQTYYEEHPEIFIDTPTERLRVRLWAGVVMDGAGEAFPMDMDEEETGRWIEQMERRSAFRAGWTPKADGRFAALCTCTYDYGNARFVVYGQVFPADAEEAGGNG